MFENIWTEKYRPQILNDLLLTEEVKSIFESYRTSEEIPNTLLIGSPGTGKTTLSKIIAKNILQCTYLYINASDENGIDTIRTKVSNFAQTKSFDGKIKIIILDEADGISLEGQRCLRNTMEEYLGITRFILTGNYKHKIIEPLQSRCLEFEISPTIKQCVARCLHILNSEKITIPAAQNAKLVELIRNHYPDLRKCINELQKYSTDGTLNIKDVQFYGIIEQLYPLIKNKKVGELRKLLIENEQSFNNDYQNLLRKLFNYVDKNESNLDFKKYSLLVIAEHLYRSVSVVDQEINCYACLISLCEKV